MSAVVEAIDYLLKKAKSKNAEIEVMGVHRQSTSIAFAGRKLESFSFSETRQVGVRAVSGKNEGVAYSENLNADALDMMLDEALANSKMIQQDWPSELRSAAKLASMGEIYNPALQNVPVEKKIEIAATLEAAALDMDPRISVPYARYGDGFGEVWLANSRGLMGSYKSNSCGGAAYALIKDGDVGVMAGESESQRDFSKINPKLIAETAAKKTLERLGAIRPQTGRYTIVFDHDTAESIIGLIAGYFSAKAVDERTSPLGGRLGEKVFSDELTIIDDPFHAQGSGSRPFDDEGFESNKTPLIENGVVKSFLTNSAFAKKLKLPHTASASRAPSTEMDISTSNLIVKPGTQSVQELLKSESKVILITNALGFAGVRRTSGDFSIPVEGFLYENGVRGPALKDFLISGNLIQTFANVTAVGNDQISQLASIRCPSLKVADVNVAGQS